MPCAARCARPRRCATRRYAAGDQPFGAVVMRGDAIVGYGAQPGGHGHRPDGACRDGSPARRGAPAAHDSTCRGWCWCRPRGRAACARPRPAGLASRAWSMRRVVGRRGSPAVVAKSQARLRCRGVGRSAARPPTADRAVERRCRRQRQAGCDDAVPRRGPSRPCPGPAKTRSGPRRCQFHKVLRPNDQEVSSRAKAAFGAEPATKVPRRDFARGQEPPVVQRPSGRSDQP